LTGQRRLVVQPFHDFSAGMPSASEAGGSRTRPAKSPAERRAQSALGSGCFCYLFLVGIAVSREFIGQFTHLESSWVTCSGGRGRTMSDFARRPIEPSRAFRPVSAGLPFGSTDLANEKHYSVIEIAKLWALSEKRVRRIFEREPGVIQWCREETLHKPGYRTLRVPETVLHRTS
jgi:hypothetical protein